MACAPGMDPVGISTGGGGAGTTTPADAAPERPRFDPALRASLQTYGGGRETLGHAPGQYNYTLLANSEALGALDAGVRSYPIGSVLGVEHERRGDGSKGPSFFMEKRAPSGDRFGGWRFIAVDPDGKVLDQGALEACGGCHRDAPNDYVF